MELISNKLLSIIKNGENVTTEFKEASSDLPKSLFETVCSFLNRNGGNIFLGVKDNGEIIGINQEYIEVLKKNFINLCNNPQKIEPTVYLNINEYKFNEKVILHIYVHESSMVHKTNGVVYDRNNDGDYRVIIPERIANIYARKQAFYSENKVFPYAEMSDLREDLIKRARQMAINNSTKSHIWADMSNEEMLRSLNLIEKDLNTGKEGLTLAAILLFGKDTTILSALPHHKTDAIYRVKNLDRYDDRDDIRTNLIESYERLIAFIEKHLDDKFYLEGTQRIDIRNKIARELCANTLIHREFLNPYPAKLIIEKDKMWTENANRAKMIGEIDIYSYAPYPKNPKIAKVFKEIGLAEELGSGVKNMVKYTKLYTGGVPIFKEDDIFTTVIPLDGEEKILAAQEMPKKCPRNAQENLDELQLRIIEVIENNSKITQKELAEYLNVTRDIIKHNITKLKKKNIITREGATKNGRWIINNK